MGEIEKIVREIIGLGAHDHYFTPDEIVKYVERLERGGAAGQRETPGDSK